MIATISCAALMGIDAFKVQLEVDFSRSGMPAFTMVGLAEGAVRESKERVFSALKNCGFKVPPARITVNLAPADVRKEGSGYDLPLAIGILTAMGVIEQRAVDGWFMAGELSLSGDLKAVPGVLPLALAAREQGGRGIIVPEANGREGAVAGDLEVIGAADLGQVVRMLLGHRPGQRGYRHPVERTLEPPRRLRRGQGPGTRQAGHRDRRRRGSQPAKVMILL